MVVLVGEALVIVTLASAGVLVSKVTELVSTRVLTLPAVIWDAVTGDTGGLVPGARYYLGAPLGTLSTAPPVTSGQYVVVVGSAISSVTMLVHPELPILL